MNLHRLSLLAAAVIAAGQRGIAQTPAAATPATHGRLLGVYDAASGDAIVGASVTDRMSGDQATTSATGTVSLWFVRASGSIVDVKKLGYQPWSAVVDPTDTVPITVVLQRVPTLDAMVTTAKMNIVADGGTREGFERRCLAPGVTCYREDDLTKRATSTIGDVIKRADGMTGMGLTMYGLLGGKCAPVVLVDGFVWDSKRLGPAIDEPGGIRNAPFNPSNVEKVEVYGAPTARPGRFEHNPTCGVIAIWTK